MILDKAKMAHEWAIKYGKVDSNHNRENTVQLAWEYADAMQAEADKREKEEVEEESKNSREVRQKFINTFEKHKLCCSEEWQPDWSQAPEWAEYWYMTKDNKFQWCSKRPYQDGCNWFVNCSSIYTLDVAPTFGYTGNWRDSLRKRP